MDIRALCVCSVTQLCSTLCDPMECSIPDSSVHGILQARILEWVAMTSSRGSSRSKDLLHLLRKQAPFFTTAPHENGEGNGNPLQYSCLEKSHGQTSLVGCSPFGCEESDRTEQLHFHFSLTCVGEGNGNPLQCSPRRIPGTGSLVGCRLWGHAESDITEVA